MPIIRFQSRQWADPPAASCRCYIHPPAWRRYQIPIAPAAPPVPNFPRLRALALFGRRPPQRVEGSSCRRPKTLYGAYWRQGESGGAVESFCHVTRLHLRHGQPFARLRRAVKPQSRLRRAEGAGLDRECAVRAIIIVAATTYKGHSALFEALWIAIVGSSPFTDMSSLAA